MKPIPIPVIFCTDGIFPHTVGGMQRHSRLLVEALVRTGGSGRLYCFASN